MSKSNVLWLWESDVRTVRAQMKKIKKSLTKEEIEFAFDLGVDDDNEAFDTVTIHIFK